ncbi:MAG: hypothetical protein KAT56_05550 [Sedimentisphaerales bacterium]|nr:hypothetical protein [Sedimentisphaerales bacterium]
MPNSSALIVNALVRDDLERKEGITPLDSNRIVDGELAAVVGTGPNKLLKLLGIFILSIIPRVPLRKPPLAAAPIDEPLTGPVIDCCKLTLKGFGKVLETPAVMFDAPVEYLLKRPIRLEPRDADPWKLENPRTEELPITCPCNCPGRQSNRPIAQITKYAKLFRFIPQAVIFRDNISDKLLYCNEL